MNDFLSKRIPFMLQAISWSDLELNLIRNTPLCTIPILIYHKIFPNSLSKFLNDLKGGFALEHKKLLSFPKMYFLYNVIYFRTLPIFLVREGVIVAVEVVFKGL